MANPYTYTGYDATESARLASLWVAATAKTFWKSPAFGLSPNPLPAAFAAWGEVSERAFQRLTVKPDWGITSVVSGGRDCLVSVETVRKLPFGRLLEFKVKRPAKSRPKVMLIAPMSGHYATLLRNTVISLLPDCDVLITEWRNARNVPVSQGKFDVEDFTKHLVDFFKVSGPQTHVIAVCQPVPLTLAAVGWLAQHEPSAQPASMTLIGGPVDPDANRTEVTDFGRRVTMGQLTAPKSGSDCSRRDGVPDIPPTTASASHPAASARYEPGASSVAGAAARRVCAGTNGIPNRPRQDQPVTARTARPRLPGLHTSPPCCSSGPRSGRSPDRSARRHASVAKHLESGASTLSSPAWLFPFRCKRKKPTGC